MLPPPLIPAFVEQQVDLVGLVTVGNLVAKPLDQCPVGDIDDVRRDAQPLRQSRRLAQPFAFPPGRSARRRTSRHCRLPPPTDGPARGPCRCRRR